MKKIYLIAAFVMTASLSFAQVSACNDPVAGVQFSFDYSQNCAAAPGDLSGMSEIGFHSGVNGWANVVDWNGSGAITASNDGSDVFTVYLQDPAGYYGIASVTEYNFVFNQGPANDAAPWDSEGKPDDGNGGCSDFIITATDITETCALTLNASDLILSNEISIAPNPFRTQATITIDNAAAEVFQIVVTNVTGQVVRTASNFNGSAYVLTRDNLTSGMYFVTFQNEDGKSATQKVVVQ